MTPRFGKSFSSSHAPLLRFCSLRYAWTTKKTMGICARYFPRKREKGSTLTHPRENTRDRASTSTSGYDSRARIPREVIVYDHTVEREKNRASYSRIISFECRVAATSVAPSQCRPANIFAGIHEINREHSRGSSRFPLTRNIRLENRGGRYGSQSQPPSSFTDECKAARNRIFRLYFATLGKNRHMRTN